GDGNTGAEIDDGIGGPAAQKCVRDAMQIHSLSLADRQVVRNLSGELKLDVLRADGMLVPQIPPVLRSARVVRTDEAERRVAVVGHDLSPSKSGKGGEVARQPFLHLGLQGTVCRIACGIAPRDDAVTAAVAPVTELREGLEGCPLRNGSLSAEARVQAHRPSVGHHAAWRSEDAQRAPVVCDRGQTKLVEIDVAEG